MTLKNLSIMALVSLLSFSCVEPKKELTIETEEQKVAYAIGIDIGNNIKGTKLDTLFDAELIAAGIIHTLDTLENELVSETEALAAMKEYFQQLSEKKRQEELKKYLPNKVAGETFLAENKKNEGVVETESGLQYKVLKQGWGATPTPNDKVKVHYTGTFIDGSVFDSSVERGEPFETFVAQGIIRGWTEALLKMKKGEKWKIFLPYELAYGEDGNRGIEPYTALVFEIELIDIITAK